MDISHPISQASSGLLTSRVGVSFDLPRLVSSSFRPLELVTVGSRFFPYPVSASIVWNNPGLRLVRAIVAGLSLRAEDISLPEIFHGHHIIMCICLLTSTPFVDFAITSTLLATPPTGLEVF